MVIVLKHVMLDINYIQRGTIITKELNRLAVWMSCRLSPLSRAEEFKRQSFGNLYNP